MDLEQNKVLKFYVNELEEFKKKNIEELFDEGELEEYPETKHEKLKKNLKAWVDGFPPFCSGEIYSKAQDDMNAIEEEIIGVIDAVNKGKVNAGNDMFVCVVTVKQVYVYKRKDISSPGVLGVAGGLLGGLFSMAAKGAKNAKSPYEKEIYSHQEFMDSCKIGTEYFGFGNDIANWSFARLFKYYLSYVFRPIYRRIIKDVRAILDSKNISTDSSSIKKKEQAMFITQEQKTTSVGGNMDYIEELKRLKELLDCGILTEEEFNKKKKEILNR